MRVALRQADKNLNRLINYVTKVRDQKSLIGIDQVQIVERDYSYFVDSAKKVEKTISDAMVIATYFGDI